MEEEKNNNIQDVILNDKREFKVPDNKEKDNKKNLIYLFLITFVLGIIVVSIFLKGISPNMDLDIGENPVASMDQRDDEEDFNIRAQIDQRLKMIQNDDELPGVSEKNEGYETPEEIVKRLRGETDEYKKSEKDDVVTLQTKEQQNNTMEPVRVQMKDIPPANTVSKIYIGQYSTMDKAVEMQENIINSGVNISPIIKEVNGYYTVQAGVFSNYESAKALSNQLINAGFAAKIVREVK